MAFGSVIQRRLKTSLRGGRNARNTRPDWIGMGGRNQSESVAGLDRNTQFFEIMTAHIIMFCSIYPTLDTSHCDDLLQK
jgi:hypothetical protein